MNVMTFSTVSDLLKRRLRYILRDYNIHKIVINESLDSITCIADKTVDIYAFKTLLSRTLCDVEWLNIHVLKAGSYAADMVRGLIIYTKEGGFCEYDPRFRE